MTEIDHEVLLAAVIEAVAENLPNRAEPKK
jgi:hypothetical protein